MKQVCGEELSVPSILIEYIGDRLYVDGVLQAEFRKTKASRGDHIVKSFEEAGWRKQEINFEKAFASRRALSDCLRNLNAKTNRIKFTQVGDSSVEWKLVDTDG